MADQANARGGPPGISGRERAPSSPSRSKVVRSQRIAPSAQSPVDTRSSADRFDEASEALDRAPPIPRSHTPGHLSSKSQDRRRKPSELSIRQRSQSSAAVGSAPASAALSASQLSASQASFATTNSKTPTPTSARHAGSTTENGDLAMSALITRERQDSSAGSGKETGSGSNSAGRRPTGLRSTSAIAARPGTAAPSVARVGTGRGGPTRGAAVHTAFPPLADPRTAPDVPAAPSSGMYWSRAPVSGSAHTALRAHTTTLVGSNVFVFGGCDSRACFNELYVLDADAFYWSTPHVMGDVPVPLRAMTCTAVGKKLVIFGGGDGPAYYNDVYVLDTVNFRWSRPRMLGDRAPSKRRAHTACLYKNGIYVFGGGDGVRALNDIWRLDVSDINKMSWKLISGPSSADRSPAASTNGGKDLVPKARGYHTANMVGSKLIIYGGSDGGECFNDVWVYDVETHVWKAVGIPVTFRRLSHTATIVGSYLFVVGGHDGNEYSNDVLLLNLVTMSWDKRKVYGLPPSGRGYHGAVLYDSRLLMIGGFDGSEVFGDVWVLELAVHAYYSQISHFTIEV
ncbi:Tip elongation aberrant protein 1 [Podospora aff. communis PSN243]|uniref:Tip elongation aberrant protein 1 n=1 Tax=Podospora aff. communis PSN243 TaxID=3040156 RepID=A0AAV9GTZ7_9PEZI|nr:Tip elongation aberrant protein 1 [Podospora aff. communis PSN243]